MKEKPNASNSAKQTKEEPVMVEIKPPTTEVEISPPKKVNNPVLQT